MSASRRPPVGWLGIDVAAELATLSTRQLHGPWQVPAELVRELLRRGARSVAVRFGRRSFSVRAEGVVVALSHLELLAAAFDPAREAAARHRAVVSLEAAGAHALLWLLGLAGAEVEVRAEAGGGARLLRRLGQAPRVEAWSASPARPVTEITVRGGGLALGQSEEWLRSACRFAPVPVEVDGERLEPRFPDGLLRARVERPLPAILSVAASGEAPLLWLLQHGVVSTRATVPGYPAFQAAVEVGGLVPSPASPAALREATGPFLVQLIDQAIGLLVRAAQRLPELPPVTARRVTLLLLEAAQQGLQRSEIGALPLLPAVGDRGTGFTSLDQLRAAAGTPLSALDPDQDLRRYVRGGRTVLLLGAEERRLLGDLLGLGLEPPPRRRRSARLAGLASVTIEALRGLVLRTGMVLSEADLSPDERRFLAALRPALAQAPDGPVEPVMVSGGGASGRVGRRLLLPRRSPEVALCVRVAARDPGWLYPALLALAGSALEPPTELRRLWLERWQTGGEGEPAGAAGSSVPRG